MGFNIPNDPTAPVNPAAYSFQSQVDRGDIDALVGAFYGTGVSSGLAVTPHNSGASLNVDVAAGVAVLQQHAITLAAVSNLTIGAADPSNPRIDLVIVNTFGTVSVAAGTASATPDYPALTFDSKGNITAALLAAVTIPAGATSITSSNIIDKRVPVLVAGPGAQLAMRSLYR